MQSKNIDQSKAISNTNSTTKQPVNELEISPGNNTNLEYCLFEKNNKNYNINLLRNRSTDTPIKQNCFNLQFQLSNEKKRHGNYKNITYYYIFII